MRALQQAFISAFEAYNDELFRHASMRLKDRDRALELTQECFLKVWEYAQKGAKIRELRPFLYRTLRHLIIDEYRRKKPVSLEAMAEGFEDKNVEALLPPDQSNTLEAAIERFDGVAALAALQELPDTYKLDGSMVYAIKTSVFLKKKTFIPKGVLAFEIPRWRAVDIDEPQDFIVGELIYRNRKKIEHALQTFR